MPTRPRKRETPAGSVSPKSQTLRAVPPEPSFTCPDGSRKKRSCLGTAEEAAETVACLFPLEQSPVIDAAAASSSETHRSQEVFSNALEESRLSDAFLSWPVTSFAEDDETSRERLEAPWHEVLWGQSDSLMSLGHADNGEQANQVAESETPHARSIPERSAAALHTPLTRGAKVDEMNASSKVLERMPSPGHQIPSLPGIFELSNNILLSPVTSRQQLHGPKSLHSMSSPLVGSAKGTNETTLGSPDPIKHSYSMSLSSSKDSEEEDAEDNSSQSPHTPSSMKIVLGHPMQSQSVFESINNKLKRTPQQRRPATPRTREAPQPPRPQCTNYPTSHHPGMYPPHQPMQYDGYVPLYHGYPTQPRPADVAISYRRERPCSRPVTAIHTKIVSSTTKESIPAATERKSIVVSAEKMGKENGPKQRNSKEMQVSCNCKKSRCLKLYCDCFSQNRFCNSCKCDDCHNTPLFKSIRDVAVMEVLSKNPQAFKPRIETKSHSMGCRCKKSRCLKKYCECFEARVLCTDKCKCSECQNTAGSQALIDQRRKIGDDIGAKFAMEESERKWKSQGPARMRSDHEEQFRGPMQVPPPFETHTSYGYHTPMHMYIPYSAPYVPVFPPPHILAAPSTTDAEASPVWPYHRDIPSNLTPKPSDPSSRLSEDVPVVSDLKKSNISTRDRSIRRND